MAYPYRGPQAPRDGTQNEAQEDARSPNKNSNRMSGGSFAGNDSRGGLARRFTLNALPTLSPIGQQRRQAAGDMSSGAYGRHTTDRRAQQIEDTLQLQRRLNAQLEQLDPDARREIEAGIRHETAVTNILAQSEPSTPPEYHDAFSASRVRPNRYSTASLTSPPGIMTRPHRSSTQMMSPPGTFVRPYTANATNLPSHSVPGSRRHSDDEEEDESFLYAFETGVHRAAANPNRNSMPVTSSYRKRNTSDLSSAYPLNTTSFLFDDDEKPTAFKSAQTSPDTKTYLQVQHTADGFPKLIRREDHSELLSGSAALDLALASKPNGEQQLTDRATAARHRISLPHSAMSSNGNIAPLNSILANANEVKPPANNRRSMEVKFTADTKRPSLLASPPRAITNGNMMSHPSYTKSTNDIPTLNTLTNISGDQSNGGVPINSPPAQFNYLANSINSTIGEQNNLESISRVTSATNSSRQSRDFTAAGRTQEQSDFFTSIQSGLQANATPFGPIHQQDPNQMPAFNQQGMPFNQPAYYGGYGMNTGMNSLNNGFGNINLGGYGAQGQWPNQMQSYQQQGGYGGSQQHFSQNGQAVTGAGRFHPRSSEVQQRKQQADDYFANVTVPELVGQIYTLCKDQHGCRFLQRKLEEHGDNDVQIIFDEVKSHFIELMTDPFGNYLCQRLLEHADDEQRTALVLNAAPDLTQIALNQHGTRALQRMIEFISTDEQTQLIIEALRNDVVQLIQDLNGNHVIQKCLNHLSSQDAQFIFDAVGANCVTVGTHRHGCCVLQRCVDHATGTQKGELIGHIINNAFALVQDPFGNYVVQYILDLAETSFTEPLCRSFAGNIIFLSKQKFSSNVIEKCLRCAEADTRRILITEITDPYELEKLLRDSFANYVIQTAIDFADEECKGLLIDHIRPIMPSIRNTPYGRRIQTKISDYDNSKLGLPPGTTPPNAFAQNNMAAFNSNGIASSGGAPRANRMGMIGAPQQWADNNNMAYTNSAPFTPNVEMASPQRNQAYNMLNGMNHFSSPNGFEGSAFSDMSSRSSQPYGHF